MRSADAANEFAPLTIGGYLTRATAELASAGVATPRLDAELLVAAALGLRRNELRLVRQRTLDRDAEASAAALLARRRHREPVSRILGRREFWSLDLVLTPAALDPRPDSETIVEAALVSIADRAAPLRLLDLGTGSGALLLALLVELPNASGVGIDCSPGAAALARVNASAVGVGDRAAFVVADWGKGIAAAFDIIVCNPPYIEAAALGSLEPEVLFDPIGSLDGGPDGLAAYRALAPQLERLLASSGVAILEIGVGQRGPVGVVVAERALKVVTIRTDLAGIERAVVVRHAAA
ncbi:MAG: peptide chain release factor N(5)-glutamine methyltransferase [Alphaproteobacteria bacterium]|nr:peptide chain release factor N(5)-glutamine methyltransferase [Alphaproteobacteria bacterium]